MFPATGPFGSEWHRNTGPKQDMSRATPLILATAIFMENMDSTVIATSLAAIARLTERGIGIATLPRGCDLSGPGLCELDVNATLPPLPLYCVWRRSSDAAIYQAIADLARGCAEQHQLRSRRPTTEG